MDVVTLSIMTGLVAMVGLGLNGAAMKPFSEGYGAVPSVLWRNVVMVVVLLALLPAVARLHFPITGDYRYIAFSVLLGVLFYLPLLLFYKGLSAGKVGVVVPVANANAVITSFLGIVFFEQLLTSLQWIAIVLTIGGVVLFSMNLRDWKQSAIFTKKSGLPYAFAVLIMWGVLFAFVGLPASHVGPLLNALVVEGTLAVCGLIHLVISGGIKNIRPVPRGRLLRLVILAGICAAIASAAFNVGLAFGSIAIVATLMGASPLVAAVYSWFVYGERLSTQEYVAGLVTIVGIVLISV